MKKHVQVVVWLILIYVPLIVIQIGYNRAEVDNTAVNIILLSSLLVSYLLGGRAQYEETLKMLEPVNGEHVEMMKRYQFNILAELDSNNACMKKLEKRSAAEYKNWTRLKKDIKQIIVMTEKINALQAASNELARKLENYIEENESLRKPQKPYQADTEQGGEKGVRNQ